MDDVLMNVDLDSKYFVLAQINVYPPNGGDGFCADVFFAAQ
jgi:hypothetical protein